MALPRADHVRDAHYHPIRASQTWQRLAAAEQAKRARTPGQDARHDRERHDETTYARHELGYH